MKIASMVVAILGMPLWLAGQVHNGTQEEQLKGHIKTITTKEYADYAEGRRVNRTTVVTYSDRGKETREEIYTGTNKSSGISTSFKYDDKGVLIQKCRYFSLDNSVDSKSTYEYGNNSIKMREYDKDGKLIYTELVKTEKSGRATAKRSFYEPGDVHTDTYKYDSRGYKIEEYHDYTEHFDASSSPEKITYTYDSHGNMTGNHAHYKDGRDVVNTWTYDSFDKEGNWLKRSAYVNKVPGMVYEREIEYY